jgi:hypothetical protein
MTRRTNAPVRSWLNSEPTTKIQINEAPSANALVMNREAKWAILASTTAEHCFQAFSFQYPFSGAF